LFPRADQGGLNRIAAVDQAEMIFNAVVIMVHKNQSTSATHITSRIRDTSKTLLITMILTKSITTMGAEVEVVPPGSVPQLGFVFVRIFQHFATPTGGGEGLLHGFFSAGLTKS
jgi:hypothetical protein